MRGRVSSLSPRVTPPVPQRQALLARATSSRRDEGAGHALAIDKAPCRCRTRCGERARRAGRGRPSWRGTSARRIRARRHLLAGPRAHCRRARSIIRLLLTLHRDIAAGVSKLHQSQLCLLCIALSVGCHRERTPSVTSPEQHARAAIEQLEEDNPDPLAELITPETTWDGESESGTLSVGVTTTRANIEAASAAAKALVGDFRRVAFVWSEGDWIYVVSEHAAGDFVYMVRFDANQRLAHLTFSTPDRLPAPSGCQSPYGQLLEDGTIFNGPTKDATPTIAIVGTLGGRPNSPLPNDLASALACRGVASILVPAAVQLEKPPDGLRLVVAHRRDLALVPPGLDTLILDETQPKPTRDSGRSILAASHLAPAVVERVIARLAGGG